MPEAHRIGDIGSGHACHFPPSPALKGSPDVYVNGREAMRVGDPYVPHGCPAGHAQPHPRALAQGSGSIYINGLPAGRAGDAINCGGSADAGLPDVSFGD